MHYLKKNDNIAPVVKFKFTLLGIIYFLFSSLLLLSGLVRGEIFSSVCAAGLILYFIFAFFSLIITSLVWRKSAFKICLKNNTITISPTKQGKETKRAPLCMPAVISFYCFVFFTDIEIKSRKLIFNIKLNKSETFFSIPQSERGRFFPFEEYIELADIAGFFSFRFFQKEKNIKELFIEPCISNINFPELPEILNETFDARSNFKRNDELYDVRPYTPGDDTRKINWKLFAHTEELSIKQGDFVPPPQKFFTLYIAEPQIAKINTFFQKKYDEFINTAASFAAYLYEHNMSFSILFYDNIKREFNIENIKADDKKGLEKIKRTFCIPQVKLNNEKFVLPVFNNEVYKKSSLLCFFMPSAFLSTTVLTKNFSNYKNKVVFYFGIKQKITNPKNLIYSFLFRTRVEKKTTVQNSKLNAKIENTVKEMRKGGFYAYTL